MYTYWHKYLQLLERHNTPPSVFYPVHVNTILKLRFRNTPTVVVNTYVSYDNIITKFIYEKTQLRPGRRGKKSAQTVRLSVNN